MKKKSYYLNDSATSSSSSSTRIWVADFPDFFLEGDLLELFIPFGEVESIVIVRKDMGQPMAFVDMKNPLNAWNAISNLNGKIFRDQSITVKESYKKIQKEKCIYALLSLDKKECYIGETINLKKRLYSHFNGKSNETSHVWISRLDHNPKSIELEIVPSSYDTNFHAIFLETVWRLVATRCNCKVINFPHILEIGQELSIAVESRIQLWPELLKFQ